MLTSYLVWLRSHGPCTYEFISVKCFLNQLEYLMFHNFQDNQVSNKDSMQRFYIFLISSAQVKLWSTQICQAMCKKAQSVQLSREGDLGWQCGLVLSGKKGRSGTSFTKPPLYSLETTTKNNVILNKFRQTSYITHEGHTLRTWDNFFYMFL